MKALLLPMVTLLVAAAAAAEDHAVSQKGREFAPVELKVKAGDRVVFHNDDDVTHNVFSSSDGAAFNVKLQEPGSKNPVAFEKAGVVDVRTAIHPKMKLRIVVEE
jgi:plastocyanin